MIKFLKNHYFICLIPIIAFLGYMFFVAVNLHYFNLLMDNLPRGYYQLDEIKRISIIENNDYYQSLEKKRFFMSGQALCLNISSLCQASLLLFLRPY